MTFNWSNDSRSVWFCDKIPTFIDWVLSLQRSLIILAFGYFCEKTLWKLDISLKRMNLLSIQERFPVSKQAPSFYRPLMYWWKRIHMYLLVSRPLAGLTVVCNPTLSIQMRALLNTMDRLNTFRSFLQRCILVNSACMCSPGKRQSPLHDSTGWRTVLYKGLDCST